jgi:gluconokinase
LIILVMGVSGSGKTSVGQALAQRLHCPFSDADSFHPEANRAKMAAGIALTDEDRLPWLRAVGTAIRSSLLEGNDHVFACSALKSDYRRLLDPHHECKLVYLRGSRQLLAERLAGRQGHFFNPDLLQSQLDTLEEPKDAVVIDIAQPMTAIIESLAATFSA